MTIHPIHGPNRFKLGIFAANADGGLMLAVGKDAQYADVGRVMDQPGLAADERSRTSPARVGHRSELSTITEDAVRTRPTHEWVEALLDVGVPCGPINDVPTALNDPQTTARGMVQRLPHPLG